MSNVNELYIDGIGKIDFIGGVIRMELVALQSEENKKEPTPVVRQRVIMPARGLLQSLSVIQNMVQKMVDAGVIQQTDQTAGNGDRKAAAKK